MGAKSALSWSAEALLFTSMLLEVTTFGLEEACEYCLLYCMSRSCICSRAAPFSDLNCRAIDRNTSH